MNSALAAALILLLPALTATQAQARDPRRDNSPYDSSIRSGMDYIRDSGSDGKAMYRYMKKDPVPIVFEDLPRNVEGLYRSEKTVNNAGDVVRDDSRIVLRRGLRGAPASKVGEVLFHEYIHRAQDQSGRPGDKSLLKHSQEGFDKAQGHIRDDGLRPVRRRDSAPKAQLRKISFSNSSDGAGGTAFGAFRSSGVRGLSSSRISRASHARGAARVASSRRAMRALGASRGGRRAARAAAAAAPAGRATAVRGRTFRAVY